MRKKYLSALLFGALLFASAGTFTSCKDYDDDIKDLQEQVNTIRTDLDNLKATVEGLDGVKTLKYENNQLVIETGKGTKVEVDIPTGTQVDGVTEVKLVGNVLYVDGKEMGKVEIPEAGTLKVEVKDGKLYINDKVQDLEVGNKVVMVDNGDGTYTMTIDGKSYVLPKATSSVSVSLDYDLVGFTNLSYDYENKHYTPTSGAICWGKADKFKGEWGGLKPVTKGQLLVGQIKSVDVKVSPATFDLSSANLTLVNTLGEKANVIVTPVPAGNDKAASTSRTSDAKGEWKLQIAMDDQVAADNIGSIFANEKNDGNTLYALAVDGKVVTGYDIVVDTDETESKILNPVKAENIAVKYKNKEGELEELSFTATPSQYSIIPLGETTFYIDAKQNKKDVDVIYDSYIEIKDIDKAETLNITANGMTINAPEETAGAQTLPIMIHYLDVKGNEIESSLATLKFASSETAGETIKDQEYKLMPNAKGIIVDLGNTFTSLTPAQADALATNDDLNGKVEWETAADAKTLKNTIKVNYYATLEDAQNGEKTISINGSAPTLRTIKYAVIAPSSYNHQDAEAGENKITIKLKKKDGNEIKKVSTTLTVTLPTFDEVAEANSANNLWNEAKDTFTTRIEGANVSIKQAWASKKAADGSNFFSTIDKNLSYELTYTNVEGEVVTKNISNVNVGTPLDKFVTKDGKMIHDFTAKATLTFVDNTKLSVTKEFKVYVMSIFEGGKLEYYVADKAVDVIDVTTDGLLHDGGLDNDKKKLGLYLTFRGKTQAYAQTAGATIDGINVAKLIDNNIITSEKELKNPDNNNDVNIAFDNSSEGVGKLNVQSGGVFITVNEQGQKGTIKVTFKDKNGVKTDCSLVYEKKKK